MKFPGTNESYVALPVSIKEDLNYQEAFTIEMTLRPETAQFQFLWTIGTGFQTDYLFFNPRLANGSINAVSYTHLRAHETGAYLVCRLLLEKVLDLRIL